MDLGHIAPQDWRQFEKEHSQAYNFLLDRALRNELAFLNRFIKLTPAQKARKDELVRNFNI